MLLGSNMKVPTDEFNFLGKFYLLESVFEVVKEKTCLPKAYMGTDNNITRVFFPKYDVSASPRSFYFLTNYSSKGRQLANSWN